MTDIVVADASPLIVLARTQLLKLPQYEPIDAVGLGSGEAAALALIRDEGFYVSEPLVKEALRRAGELK